MAASSQAVIPASSGRGLAPGSLRRLALVLLLGGMLALAGWGLSLLRDPATLPISRIQIMGNVAYLDEAMLREAVTRLDLRGFFSIDIVAVKQQVEALPWVASASVRRIWPDALAITVVEQKPLARWSGGGLVNEAGQAFAPPPRSYPDGLPLFEGPAAMLPAMGEAYRLAGGLLARAGLSIRGLRMDSRRALSLRLDKGFELMLGREHTAARLRRFIRVYDSVLAARTAEIVRVDLRYSHGMAVQWQSGSSQKIMKEQG